MLSLELRGGVGLPHVVECCEEDDARGVGGEGALDGADGCGLVRFRGNGNAVVISLPRPSGLGDDDVLVLVGQDSAESGDLGGEEASGVSCDGVAVKEGMAVDGAVVGGITERWVGACCNKSVDSDNLPGVTSGLQEGASSANGSDDGGSRGSARVDKLVANCDGVERAPVTTGSGDNDGDFIAKGAQVEDTSEHLETLGLGSRENGCNLVAISSVHSN